MLNCIRTQITESWCNRDLAIGEEGMDIEERDATMEESCNLHLYTYFIHLSDEPANS